jgi:4-aminobutyrate aminotransferase / (S)-3-amino-2-methylpropionate transaminase
MGDPVRALQARELIKVIKRDNLVENTEKVGSYIYDNLKEIQSTVGKGKMFDLRGKDEGTFIAFDCETPEKRDKFILEMKKKGVNMGGCGVAAVRLR